MNFTTSEIETCYLCGLSLSDSEVNDDHVFQKQFVQRSQPREPGFEYAGTIKVHSQCNSMFGNAGQGPEWICKKALQLFETLYSDHALWRELKSDPEIRIVAIPMSKLSGFTKADLHYFKINDFTEVKYNRLKSRDFYSDKLKTEPHRIPLNVALSVLVKSTAGFLVRRHSFPPDSQWRILVLPHIAPDNSFDLSEIFGRTKPLELGISLWIARQAGGWFCAYKFNRLLLFLCFESTPSSYFALVKQKFPKAQCLLFESSKLTDLVGYDWYEHEYRA